MKKLFLKLKLTMNKITSFKKNTGFLIIIFLTFILIPFVGCGKSGMSADTLNPGIGEFLFTHYKPLANKPVTVHYYRPDNLPDDAPIMILLHGNGRNADGYRKGMMSYAEHHKFLLIVPEFSKEIYPNSRDYHQGGVFTKEGKMKPKEDWTFSIIEPLFEHVKMITGKKNEGYILYGFSAGSQFIHRFTWFFPDNNAIKTISSSAGSYTMPDYKVNYLYGLKNTKIPKENLVKAFAKDFTVAIGDADTVLNRSDLPKSPQANKQGRDRVERAINFYNVCKDLAKKEGVPFNWKLVVVPHVGHTNSEMAGPVARMLFE